MKYDIKDKNLAPKGKLRIEWAGSQMKVLELIKRRFAIEKPLEGITLGACLHVTAETANLMITLKEGGASLALCASNPLSTQDEVATSLVTDYKIPTFAIKGEDKDTYYKHLNAVLDFNPKITMDDGADLVTLLHTERKSQLAEVIGSSEETTTGVIRLRAMLKDGTLKIPVMAVNDSSTKHMFDNRYGTGQSTIDGIIRATNVLLAGKKFVVVGYGWCGRGLAQRARGMGSLVIVCEVDPLKALEATMDGFDVMPIGEAIKIADIICTATGNKTVLSVEHFKKMKDGAIVANTGHFNVEFDYEGLVKIAKNRRLLRDNLEEITINGGKRIFVLGEGRLINLASAEGHPPDVMDMSFANQALAAEFLVENRGKLKTDVYRVPKELDDMIAELKLKSLGISIDTLTEEQKIYLVSWKEGT
ncbi:adenosylhomocysteinase [Candidatus Daviesbacteria bacterium RIFCSPHIGHO2_01_FULL_40_11]|uniref:Adenosylhomocysteinase n=1 Tax=Candidatus Daviesbacteria bacterium RIFCSPHIGHO2_01_FULL_40_11 TaxID=1797762 RepID=A0A1F5JH64_9BACT|nr:MAG: adenosylhomocysteinase [Candidatus Daviesbacteria bacterium RIFCSPHIGHO2_01_FULL_40_11]OGE62858.1 MAG: adenosylhomocysteinase [Candidatus Daviesbacteria bacterium RIFCSPLOWO2_01_FULL_40_27]